MVEEGAVRCPLCRRQHLVPGGDIAGFPLNTVINNLIEETRKRNQLCGGCARTETAKYCVECRTELCDTCAVPHENLPCTNSHRLLALEEYRKTKHEDPASLLSPSLCSRHTEIKLKFYCDECAVPVCSECLLTDHPQPQHTYRPMEEASTQIKTQFAELSKKLAQKEKEASESVVMAHEMARKLEQRSDSEKKKIEDHADNIRKDVDANERELLTKLKKAYDDRSINLKAQLKELELAEIDLMDTRAFVEQLMQHGSPSEVVTASKGVFSHAESLIRLETKQRPVEDDYLRFEQTLHPVSSVKGCLGEIGVSRHEMCVTPEFPRVGQEVFLSLQQEGASEVEAGGVRVEVKSPDGETKEAKVKGREEGDYSVGILGTTEGVHQLSVSVNNAPVRGSPCSVKVIPCQGLSHNFCSEGQEDEQLWRPHGVMLYKNRDVLVCDSGNKRLKLFQLKGAYLNSVDFSLCDFGASFTPRHAAVSVNGFIYITDSGALQQVIVCDENFKLVRCFGRNELKVAMGIAISPIDGKVYVVDDADHRVHIYSADDTYIKSFGGKGEGHGSFSSPSCVCVAAKGEVIVSDTKNHRIQVFDAYGKYLKSFGSYGSHQHKFDSPEGVATDRDGNVYVCDYGNNRVQKFSADYKYICMLKSDESSLQKPGGVCVTDDKPHGKVIVSEQESHRISVFCQ
ncbi:E3 ubiquitin-protein ligase TRIM71-like [Ptychodera flava]|uniref:E3 ubiquitin-protein ligase TRIM71-like n=1 Tax=Ptychodera flava TaxID=63121 RepID=UPI00396A21DF